MKATVIRTLSAEKQNFKKFKLNNEFSSRLEFISHNLGYQIKYDDKDFGIFDTNNPDLMIKDFLEDLAEYNNGDSKSVETKLNNLVEKKSTILFQQYPTIYKNSTLKYLLGVEDNIVKNTCIEQQLTYRELGERIGFGEGAIKNAAASNKISDQLQKAIEMFLEIEKLKKENEKYKKFQALLKELVSL